MKKQNIVRCPVCRGRLRVSCGPSVSSSCRCGYHRIEPIDNITKEFIYGPLFRTKKKRCDTCPRFHDTVKNNVD